MVLLELTSSHLCFTTRSPTIAVITCFWPDHLELHGSLERYRAAKEAIVRRQRPDDVVVANEDDGDAAAIASLSPGHRFGFSATPRGRGRRVRPRRAMVLRDASGERSFRLPPHLDAAASPGAARRGGDGARRRRAAGEAPRARFRLRTGAARVGRLGDTELIDDGMAATPAKTASALHEYPDASVVLVAGGELESGGLPVHASREEQAPARGGVRRGAPRRAPRRPLRPRRRSARPQLRHADRRARAATLDEAIGLASAHAEGAKVLVVSPMFPLPLADRERIAPALQALATAGNSA